MGKACEVRMAGFLGETHFDEQRCGMRSLESCGNRRDDE